MHAMQKPVVSGWNRPTAEYYDVPSARVGKAPPRFRFFGICGVTAALIGWQGYTLSATHDILRACRADVALRAKHLCADSCCLLAGTLSTACSRKPLLCPLSEVSMLRVGLYLCNADSQHHRQPFACLVQYNKHVRGVGLITGWLLYALAGICLTVALRWLTSALLRKPSW